MQAGTGTNDEFVDDIDEQRFDTCARYVDIIIDKYHRGVDIDQNLRFLRDVLTFDADRHRDKRLPR